MHGTGASGHAGRCVKHLLPLLQRTDSKQNSGFQCYCFQLCYKYIWCTTGDSSVVLMNDIEPLGAAL